MSEPSRRVIRGFAGLDLLVTAPFAVPGLAPLVIEAFHAAERGLGGDAVAPGFTPLQWLFVHLTGILGVVWAVARLRLPDPRLARIDGVGRLVVAGFIAVLVFGHGGPRVLLAFLATELAGAVAQLRGAADRA